MSEAVKMSDVLKDLPLNTSDSSAAVCVTSGGALFLHPIIQSMENGLDLDSITKSGSYRLNQGSLPMPPGISSLGCVLLQYDWDVNRTYQILFASKGIYYRMKAFDWKPWQQFSVITVST